MRRQLTLDGVVLAALGALEVRGTRVVAALALVFVLPALTLWNALDGHAITINSPDNERARLDYVVLCLPISVGFVLCSALISGLVWQVDGWVCSVLIGLWCVGMEGWATVRCFRSRAREAEVPAQEGPKPYFPRLSCFGIAILTSIVLVAAAVVASVCSAERLNSNEAVVQVALSLSGKREITVGVSSTLCGHGHYEVVAMSDGDSSWRFREQARCNKVLKRRVRITSDVTEYTAMVTEGRLRPAIARLRITDNG